MMFVDRNECMEEPAPCHANAVCTDTVGSYTCNCSEGFVGDGLNCMGELETCM